MMFPHLWGSPGPKAIMQTFIEKYDDGGMPVHLVADAAFCGIDIFTRLQQKGWTGTMSCSEKVETSIWEILQRNVGDNEFKCLFFPELRITFSCCGTTKNDMDTNSNPEGEENDTQRTDASFHHQKLITSAYLPTQIFCPSSGKMFNLQSDKYVAETGEIIGAKLKKTTNGL